MHVSADTSASIPTPPFAQIHLKSWVQQQCSLHVEQLQETLDGPGVDKSHIDACMRAHTQFKSAMADLFADGTVWLGLYTFELESGCVVGVLVAPKTGELTSERHCAVFLQAGCEAPNELEINRLLWQLSADIAA